MARSSTARTTTTRYRTLDGPSGGTCVACREPLPVEAQFCPACGVCMLELDDDDVEEIDELELDEDEIEIEV